MNTTWCLKSPNTRPVIIDKVLTAGPCWPYSNAMAKAFDFGPVIELWRIYAASSSSLHQIASMNYADRVCFEYSSRRLPLPLITRVITDVLPMPQAYLMSLVDSALFGNLPQLINPSTYP